MTTEIPAVQHMSAHVLSHLSRHRSAACSPIKPLFVGVQGPQGSGKTFLTSKLRDSLISEPHNLSVVVLSIDDLYLPHTGLAKVAEAYPGNRLLKGRGLPGTHDVQLGREILNELKGINETGTTSITLPVFEKSLHNGEGDRTSDGIVIKGPVDVVVMEGWCLGFCPINTSEIEKRWEGMSEEMKSWCPLEDVKIVNNKLKDYRDWWDVIDVFIQIGPSSPSAGLSQSPYTVIYKWRLQQEHNMKARNGGKGMTDDQVISFVDRYIPGYIYFSGGVVTGPTDDSVLGQNPPKWIGKGLKILIGEERDVVGIQEF